MSSWNFFWPNIQVVLRVLSCNSALHFFECFVDKIPTEFSYLALIIINSQHAE